MEREIREMTDIFSDVETPDPCEGYKSARAGAPEAVAEWDDIDHEWRDEVYEEVPVAIDIDNGTEARELDRQAAERLVKRLHLLEREAATAALFIDEEISRARLHLESLIARRAELVKPIERKQEWLKRFTPALESWARQTLEHAKSRSIKMAYGTLKFRKNPDRMEVLDEAAAIQWAMQNGYSDCWKTTFVRGAAKKRTKENGEVPPGCDLVQGEDVFEVVSE